MLCLYLYVLDRYSGEHQQHFLAALSTHHHDHDHHLYLLLLPLLFPVPIERSSEHP